MVLSTAVVISTYNGESYIEEQLDSIREQSQVPDEVWIVDDRSTDHTTAIVDDYIHKFALSKWHLVINKRNKGWEQNFIDGMSLTNSDLIFPCDQDDYWHPDKIKIMSELMQDNLKIDVLACGYHKNFMDHGHPTMKPVNGSNATKIDMTSSFMRVAYPGCTYCVRRTFFEQVKRFWFTGCPHDALLWRTAMFNDGLYRVNGPLIEWRQHRDSSFRKQNRNKDYHYQVAYLKYNEQVISQLKASTSLFQNKRYDSYLNKQASLLHYRKRFYQSRNPLLILNLIWLLNSYPKKRTVLRDIYTVYCLKGKQ